MERSFETVGSTEEVRAWRAEIYGLDVRPTRRTSVEVAEKQFFTDCDGCSKTFVRWDRAVSEAIHGTVFFDEECGYAYCHRCGMVHEDRCPKYTEAFAWSDKSNLMNR